MAEYLTGEALVAFLSLTLMEIVLGVDNLVFVAVLAGKLPQEQRAKARNIGLGLAVIMRVMLLLGISWVIGLKGELFTAFGHPFTGKDAVMLAGGLFLIYKATNEIYEKLEVEHHEAKAGGSATFGSVVAQVVMLDIVFSIDSVITAVGMSRQIPVMVAAVLVAVGVMMAFAGALSAFIDKHPSVKILALSFLLLIGVMLTADGFGQHVGKGYIYAAMGFSILVELLNMRFRSRQQPVHLHAKNLE